MMLTFPTRAGMFMELVAKPIPKVMADSAPRNWATRLSSSTWMLRLPAGEGKLSLSRWAELPASQQGHYTHTHGVVQGRCARQSTDSVKR